MTLTILLDLDDTLLDNSTAEFIPAYLDGLCSHLSAAAESPEKILPELMAATNQMMQNADPDRTLKEVFDAHFYPSLGWEYAAVQPKIETFYQTVYPKFQQLTSPNAASRKVVGAMIDRGYQIVIATNPIFPQNAVQQRLDWSDLGSHKEAFSLVTSYEKMHFTKPKLAYFTESLAQIGWPETPVVMVGDSYTADIEPARTLGIATYWVNPNDGYAQDGDQLPAGAGTLEQFPAWLSDQPTASLAPGFNSPTASIAIHQSTPSALDTLLNNLDESLWSLTPDPDSWTLTEICCHLRDVDREVHIPRIRHLTESDRPFLEAVDADSWAAARNYRQQDGKQAFADFVTARKELLALFESISEDAWQKEIRHTIFGPIKLPELLKISARHDKLHIQQIFEILKKTTSA